MDTSGDSGSSANMTNRTIMSTQSTNIVHTQLTSRKLKGLENYNQWKNAVTMSLKGRRKSIHLTDEPPAETTPEGVDWHSDDANLVNLLWDCMEPKVSDLVSHCQTVKQIWTYLELLYSGKNNASRVYEASQAFNHYIMGDKSVTDHFAEFSKLNEEFNALLPITADVQKMMEQRELLSMMTYLRSLRPEFSVIRSQILGDISVKNANEAFARVLRVTHENSTVVPDSPILDSTAMFSQGFGRGRIGGRRARAFGDRGGFQSGRTGGRGSFQGGFGRSRPRCYHCGEEGHVMAKCWKLNGGSMKGANVAVTEGMDSLGIKENPGAVTLSKEEYVKWISSQSHSHQSIPSSSTCAFVQSSSTPAAYQSSSAQRTWVIDSGASDHMTGDAGSEDEGDFWVGY